MSAPKAHKNVIRVVMLGPGLEVRGGISAVERLIIQHAPPEVHITHIPTMQEGSILRKVAVFALALARLFGILLTHRADLVHIHFSRHSSTWRKSLLAALCRLWRRPYILHAHSGGFRQFFSGQPMPLRRWIVRMLRGSVRLIALSESWKQYYEAISGLPPHKMEVLPNPIRLPENLPAREDRHVATFVFLGRMDENKGAFRLLQAMQQLPENVLNKVRLVLAGSGEVQGVSKAVQELGLSEHVTVLNWLTPEQRDALLSSCDVFVLPSLNEGLPCSLLEAMSWGLPVITSPVGGIPEVVLHEDNGWLVDPLDVQALAAAMQSFVENEPMRLQMGSRARASVERFDIDRYWQTLHEIYRSVLSESKG